MGGVAEVYDKVTQSHLSYSQSSKASEVSRQPTEVVDVMEKIASPKWSWTGNIVRRTDGGRPPERRNNGTKSIAGINWQQVLGMEENLGDLYCGGYK